MTNRQRFHETMRYGSPDHVPYFEEGIRKEVIQEWYRQGLSRNVKISDLFLRVHRGFFLTVGVYDWQRFKEVITLLLEQPDFVSEAMRTHGVRIAKKLDKTLPGHRS